MAESSATGSVQQFLGRKDIFPTWSGSSLALLKWFVDGTLIFAGTDSANGAFDFKTGLAQHYQRQFSHCPALIQAISQAFHGEHVTETLRVGNEHWDVRLFPTYSGGKLGGVIGIFTDATDRISAGRSLNAIDILFTIRHHLARSDSVDEFLHQCCQAVEIHYPAVWVGITERDVDCSLRIVTGAGEVSRSSQSLNLSWDIQKKAGRNAAAEAVRSGKIQRRRRHDPGTPASGDTWIDSESSTVLAVPLVANAVSLGVLVVHGKDEVLFEQDIVGLFEKIGIEITEGIELLRAKADRARIVGERQGAHLQYQQLLDTIFDVIVVHGDGKIITVNPAGVKLAGAASAAQLQGTPVLALIDPADRSRFKKSLGETSTVGELQEFRLLNLDGRSIDVEGLTVPIQHEGVPAQLSVWRDISERKEHEKLIFKQNTSLEYAQQVSQTGSIELEVAGGTAEWSKSALALMNISEEAQSEKLTRVLAETISATDVDRIAELIETIRTTAKEQSCEVELWQPAGHRTVQFHGIPQVEDRVYVTRIFFVIRDITSFRDTERQRSVIAEQFERAQALGQMGHFEIAAKDRTLFLSSRAARLLGWGYSPEVMVPLEQLYRQIHRHHAEKLRDCFERAFAAQVVAGEDTPTATDSSRGCALDCRLEQPGPPRWVHINAELNGASTIAGSVQDVTGRKLVEIELEETKSKLLATWRFAKIAEWTYELDSKLIVFQGSMKDFLGVESPINSIPYDTFLGTIRAQDREAAQKALEQTLRYGTPGEIVYEEKFFEGLRLLLYTRFVPEKGDDGRIRRLRGLSIDISKVRELNERDEARQRIDPISGVPEKVMAFDRIHYLAERAALGGEPFSSVVIRLQNYRDLKRHMANDKLYYDTQAKISQQAILRIRDTDIFARFDPGEFILVMRRLAQPEDITKLREIVEGRWREALEQCASTLMGSVATDVSVVNCPEHGSDSRALVKVHETNLPWFSGSTDDSADAD